MIKIINHEEADDFVISTGVTHSVESMCQYVFGKLGLNYLDHIRINDKFKRPEELNYLRGDSTKMRETFNWAPEYTFESLMDEMIDFWINHYSK